MKYRLAIYNNEDYTEINDFRLVDELDDKDPSKLENIVAFTNAFNNELDLKYELYRDGLIGEEYLSGIPKINSYKNKTSLPISLDYGVSFKNDSRLYNINNLKDEYVDRLTKDIDFLKLFLSKYYKYLRGVQVYNQSISYIYSAYLEYKETKSMPCYIEPAIRNFITVYTRKKNKDGSYSERFANIRELAMLLISNTKKEEIKENNNLEEINDWINYYEQCIRESIDDEEIKACQEKLDVLDKMREEAEVYRLARRK